MKKNRFLSWLLTGLLLSAMLSVSAFAAEPRHFHPRISFDYPIGKEADFSLNGEAFLTSDIKATGDILIENSLTICLNGHTIDMGSHSIIIEDDAQLVIYNCAEAQTGGIVSTAGEQAVIKVMHSGVLTIYAGDYHAVGRPMIGSYGTASIGGGIIHGNDVQLVQCIGNGLVSVNGGEIHAGGTGSAAALIPSPDDDLSSKRDFNLAIGACRVTADPGSPGVVVASSDRRRLVLGGGADIRGDGCPGVLVEAGIFDAYDRASVYSNSASAIVGTGGKVSLYFATVTSDEQFAVDVLNDAELLLSGSLDLNGGRAGVHLPEGKVFSMSDYGFYGDVRVTVLTDKNPAAGERIPISNKCTSKHFRHFLSANPQSSISYDEETMLIYNSYDSTVSHTHDGRNFILPLNGTYSDLNKNNYYLTQDCASSGFFTGSVVNICLNGHKLNLSSPIKIYPNSTLNIFDCQGGGSIEGNSICVSGFDRGTARIILHQGDIISYNGSAIKLNGNDSLTIRNGTVSTSNPAASAVDAEGTGNSVKMLGGVISGGFSGISVTDEPPRALNEGEVIGEECMEISGTAGKITGETYGISCGEALTGYLIFDEAPVIEGGSAQIFLSGGKKLSTTAKFAPSESYTLLLDPAAESPITVIGKAASVAHSAFFRCLDDNYKIAYAGGQLELAKSLPIQPESCAVTKGETASFSVASPVSGSYQWFLLNKETGRSISLENSTAKELTLPVDLDSGEYQLYCQLKAEEENYVSELAQITVTASPIPDLHISAAALSFTGEAQTPDVSVTTSTNAHILYSLDGSDYSENVPAIGPEIGSYRIFYKAAAPGYGETSGEFTVTIEDASAKSDKRTASEQLPRLIAIILSSLVLLVLCAMVGIRYLKSKEQKHRR